MYYFVGGSLVLGGLLLYKFRQSLITKTLYIYSNLRHKYIKNQKESDIKIKSSLITNDIQLENHPDLTNFINLLNNYKGFIINTNNFNYIYINNYIGNDNKSSIILAASLYCDENNELDITSHIEKYFFQGQLINESELYYILHLSQSNLNYNECILKLIDCNATNYSINIKDVSFIKCQSNNLEIFYKDQK